MKILLTLSVLFQLGAARASIVAIMDSGTDISHKDLVKKAWVNKQEIAGSTVDNDHDGLPGDINGWDYTENSAKVFNDKYNYLIDQDVITFYQYEAKYDLGQLTKTSPEFLWLKAHVTDKAFLNRANFVGDYIHGTHVAGISALNNPAVKIIAMKIIPTVYEEVKSDAPTAAKPVDNGEAPKTFDDVKADALKSANDEVTDMTNLSAYVNFHKADVVNQSFGIGYSDATNFIKADFVETVKRDPTDAELTALLKAYFDQLISASSQIYAAAPNTLFAVAAGNDASNNDLTPDYPADVVAENKIVVAATSGYSSLADFSNFGGTKVDVAAPGVAITSTAPTNTYMLLSGTSQATPFVVNTIAAMKDTNTALKAQDLKAILFGTVDHKDWLKNKVKTGGIVNKARAVAAAKLAKTMNLDLAINQANQTVADVAVDKSFNLKQEGMDLGIRPHRPSLLVKKN